MAIYGSRPLWPKGAHLDGGLLIALFVVMPRVRLGAQQCRIHALGVDPRCSRDHLRAIEVREVIIGSPRMPSDSHSRLTLPSTVGVV